MKRGRRKGLTSYIMMLVMMVGFTLIVFGLLYFGSLVAEISGKKAASAYTENLISVDVVGTPCATKERGVFYRSSVVSGDFNCLHPEEDIGIRVNMEGESPYIWKVGRTEEGARVEEASAVNIAFKQTYRVQVYDSHTGEHIPAEVSVGRYRVLSVG